MQAILESLIFELSTALKRVSELFIFILVTTYYLCIKKDWSKVSDGSIVSSFVTCSSEFKNDLLTEAIRHFYNLNISNLFFAFHLVVFSYSF